jgi:two-component system response regulator HydG
MPLWRGDLRMDPRLQDRYCALVKAYVAQPGEAPLAATAELGRELVRADVPIEEIGELQERTLERLARDLPDSALDAATHLYSMPLTELLMAYGLAFRELREERQRELERRLEEERLGRTRAEAEASARKEADLRRRKLRDGGAIVAESPSMRALLEEAAGIAKTDSPVLIEGETGTGKEVIAEFIHQESDRRDGIMSAVNCGALSETLVDAELFGYEKGAFTGATAARQGIIEVADMGTLLLDEVGDIPPSTQVRMLRFLERGVIRRIGSAKESRVDTRVLAATHRTLEEEVAAGRFREDLYHRLLVFRVRIPPLRERREDILPLAEHHRTCLARRRSTRGHDAIAPQMTDTVMTRRRASQRTTVVSPSFDEAARSALLEYAWPGNVRELLHTVERSCFAAHLVHSDVITPEHLNLPGRADDVIRTTRPDHSGEPRTHISLAEVERRHIMSALDRCGDNRKKTAEVLGISERNLYRLLKKYTEVPTADR